MFRMLIEWEDDFCVPGNPVHPARALWSIRWWVLLSATRVTCLRPSWDGFLLLCINTDGVQENIWPRPCKSVKLFRGVQQILHTSSADLLCVVVCLHSSHLPLWLLPLPLRPLNSKDSQKPAGWRWNGPSWVWCSSSFYLWWWQGASSGNISCQNFCQVRLQNTTDNMRCFLNVFFLSCCCCRWVKNVLKLSSLHVSQSCWVYTTSLWGSILSINQGLRFIYSSSYNTGVAKKSKNKTHFL